MSNKILLIVSVVVGIIVNIFSSSILGFLFGIAFSAAAVYFPVQIVRKIVAENRPTVKILGMAIVFPVVLVISGTIFFVQLRDEPFIRCFDSGLDGSYPVWYTNPFTQQCSYGIESFCNGESERSYWFASNRCSQDDRDRIFLKEIVPSGKVSVNISELCYEMRGATVIHKKEQDPVPSYCRDDFCNNMRKQFEASRKEEEAKEKQELLSRYAWIQNLWGVGPAAFAQTCGGSVASLLAK